MQEIVGGVVRHRDLVAKIKIVKFFPGMLVIHPLYDNLVMMIADVTKCLCSHCVKMAGGTFLISHTLITLPSSLSHAKSQVKFLPHEAN